MRSNDRLRSIWRRVDRPAVAGGADLDWLATRISRDGAIALRARASWMRWTRVAVVAGIATGMAAILVIAAIPTRPPATLLEAVSSGDAPARTFEVAVVGPPDGAWLIAAAVGADR